MSSERWQDYGDAELVVECRVGNTAAFDGLVARYRPAVLATVLRRVPARAVAEDICQEALVRAFRALPHLRDPARFAAWLHAIARREVIRHAPGESRAADHAPLDELELEQGMGQTAAGAASGSGAIERWEEGEAIRQAMASLPEELQLVLTLRYWADMPLEQIAAYLGRPLSTVKWRLHRARALMRQQLSPHGERRETHEPWRNDCDRNDKWNRPGTEADRADAGPGGGDGAGCGADRQPERTERCSGAQLQQHRHPPARHRPDLDRVVRAAAGGR